MITKNDISLDCVDVMFEITRFCNMACPHCIRGEAEKRRIKKDYINATLEQIPLVGTMMFTGGEPALAVDLMNYTLDACKHYNVEVSNFWMATNGTIASQKFFNSIEKWVSYCTENEISGLRVSIDNYHDAIDNQYAFEEFVEYGLPEDTGVKIYVEFQGAPYNEEYLIADGRAYDNYAGGRQVEHNINLCTDGRVEGSLYVNAKGFVLSTCDISYATSDAKNSEFVICHCTDDIQEKLAEFFNKHPEHVYKD